MRGIGLHCLTPPRWSSRIDACGNAEAANFALIGLPEKPFDRVNHESQDGWWSGVFSSLTKSSTLNQAHLIAGMETPNNLAAMSLLKRIFRDSRGREQLPRRGYLSPAATASSCGIVFLYEGPSRDLR
jgi:hypothetical protein